MQNLGKLNNTYNDDKVIDACSIFGAMDTSGRRFSGDGVIRAIANMHDRGNGLGGGFAVYGLYPEHAGQYAFHIMYLSHEGKQVTEEYLRRHFSIVWQEEVPTRPVAVIKNPPMVYRYFVEMAVKTPENQSEDDYVVAAVMAINTGLKDSFVFSSGKNMAVFKGSATRRKSPPISASKNTAAISGRRTAGSPPIRRRGGEAPIRSLSCNKYIVEFAGEFGYDADKILGDKFIKLYPRWLRPYGRLYAY